MDELRRYHRFLMAGGRWAAALGILIALLAEGLVLTRTYVAGERQMFAVAHRLVQGRIAANEESFLSVLARAELSWNDEREVPQSVVERFRANGNLLYWKPFPAKSLKLLIAGAPGALLDDASIERYFQLARQIGRANIGESKVLGRQLTQVFFSPDQKIVAILPASAIDRPERLDDDAGRASFIKELTGGTGYLADEIPPSPHEGRLKVYWSRQLYPLPDGRKMVRLTSPVISDDKVEAILVNEVDPRELIVPVVGGTYDGIYAIVDDAGEIAATAASNGSSSALSDLMTRWRRSHRIDAGELVEQHADGRSMLAQRLGDTGYTLIYTYSWWDVVAAVWGKTVTAAVLLSTVLAVVWLLLFQLNRRVFLPMYARAKEVFESERLSRTVIETVPIGIGLVSTGSGELLYGGSAMKALAEIVDGGMPRLLAELSMRYARLRMVQRDSSAGPMFHEDVTLRTLDGGEIALQIRFTLGRYLGEDVLVAAFVDVTASQQLARQLHGAKEAADQANAAKSAFLATMSHEIRTPLNAILGNLELLAHSPLHPLQRDRLRTICTSSNGLLAIIEDVLDFSKIEAGKMQLEHVRFNIADVMTRSLAMFAPAALAKGIVLSGTFGTAIDQTMRGDPTRLGQVMNNLLSNAIKFTAAGKVTLTVSYEPASDDPRAGDRVVVSVADTGIGIGAAERRQLFKAFVQVDLSISRRFGGTGLGLALCQRLTAQMGGSVTVDSEEGKGSCFTVRLPLDRQDPVSGRAFADPRLFHGESVTFVSAADEWHTYAVPLMRAWGATVDAFRNPDDLGDVNGRLLVICGDRGSWSAESENRLVENCRAVVTCGVNGPLQPMRLARMLTVSCYSPRGLRAALEHVLNGKPLDTVRSADEHSEAELPPLQRLGLHVLVAEDNEVNRQLLHEQLTLLGCSVRTAADGVEALRILSDETFDVVLSDLNMPRLDGYVLANIMRERWPCTPIIAVTADATVDEHARCAELGIRAVVSKPLSLGNLARVLTMSVELDGARSVESDGGAAPVGEIAVSPAVVEAFHRACGKSLDALRNAHAHDDVPAMLAELHSLKGALGVIKLRDLGRQCGELERRIGASGLAESDKEWRSFAKALEALVSADRDS
ncbi:ATP-binding protein [Burkholderia orbicola]|uniref:histidine kinase n=1 Tax=Burkholderia orbicola TaxID=2978683 RepID=A0ABT8NXQ0_9BURK|nr:ATP-binding protein [Burkholderia orbicola]MDN7526352.1 ATP-binding protein [Burkholderia orbicola]